MHKVEFLATNWEFFALQTEECPQLLITTFAVLP